MRRLLDLTITKAIFIRTRCTIVAYGWRHLRRNEDMGIFKRFEGGNVGFFWHTGEEEKVPDTVYPIQCQQVGERMWKY